MATSVEALDTTLQKTNAWLSSIEGCLPGISRHEAYAALRAVLHALRDRLSPDATAHLGAQLPMLIRGVYYEGWHPAGKPLKIRHMEEFLAHVEQELSPNLAPQSEEVTRAVFRVIEQYLDPGEIDKVIESLPMPLRELWGPPVEPHDN